MTLLLPLNLTITSLQQILKNFINSLKKDNCSIQSLKLNDLFVTDGIYVANRSLKLIFSVCFYSWTRYRITYLIKALYLTQILMSSIIVTIQGIHNC